MRTIPLSGCSSCWSGGRCRRACTSGGSCEPIVFAARHYRQSGQIGEDGPRAILSIQAEKGALFREIVCLHVRLDRRHCAAQLLAVLSVARITKGGKPLVRMSLEHGGARADDFPRLSSGVARGTQRAQATRWRRAIRGLRQGTRARRFSRPINIEDEEVVPLSVPQSARLLLFHQGAREQIFQKQRAQRLGRALSQGGRESARVSNGQAAAPARKAP